VNNETNIKQRLTGAIVLIALAVIFLPLILDGQKKKQILESQVPDKPISGEIILVNIDQQKRQQAKTSQANVKAEVEGNSVESEIINKKEAITEIILPTKSSSNVSNSESSNVSKTIKMPNPVLSKSLEKGNPTVVAKERTNRPNYQSSAFVIQVGSFGNQANADKLISKLKKAGFKAYGKNGRSKGKSLHRVFVGPELKRSGAESKLSKLNKISGLNSIIVTYDPLKH